jgi:hypothetical protein
MRRLSPIICAAHGSRCRVARRDTDELLEDAHLEPVDAVVGDGDAAGDVLVELQQRRERGASDLARVARHLDDELHDLLVARELEEAYRSPCDGHRMVAHALEVQRGVQERREQTQVATDRRLQCDGGEDAVLHLDVALVDRAVGVDDLLRADAVPLGERRDGLAEHAVRTLAHVDEHAAQLVDGPVQSLTHAALLLLGLTSTEAR